MASVLMSIENLSVAFGDRTLFHIAHLTIHEGDRIGLIGRNGCGKSTLLRLLAGEERPEEGDVLRHGRVGYAPQFGTGSGEADAQALRAFRMKGREGEDTLSGGEVARLRLSRTPFGAPLLLLDEPTANLDASGCALFREKLEAQRSFLLVSHDRALLDAVCTRIWLLEDGVIRVYEGNYAAFEQARALERQTQQRAHDQYTAQREHLQAAYQGVREKTDQLRRNPKRMGISEARLHKMGGQGAKKKMDQQRKAIQSRIDRLEVVDAPRGEAALQLDFSLTAPPETKTVLTVKELTFGYGASPLLDRVSFTLPNGSKTALQGENGCGKTTLIRLIRDGHPAIRLTPRARPGYLMQDLSCVDDRLTVLENARLRCVQSETTMRTVLRRLLFAKAVLDQPAATLSGGEKIKLSLCQLIVSDCNMLVLDEPTNYLDLPSLEALEAVLREYPGTVLLVSHDEAFVSRVATRSITLSGGHAVVFEGTLTQRQETLLTPPADDALLRSTLQMRLTSLSCRISAASAENKPALEAEYADCLAQYRQLSR